MKQTDLPNDMFTSSSRGAWLIDCGWGIKVEVNIVWPSGFFWETIQKIRIRIIYMYVSKKI